jgi:hypothetical protein
MPHLKFCGRCRALKEIEDFYVDRSKPDGHGNWCKACEKKANQEWRAKRAAIKQH